MITYEIILYTVWWFLSRTALFYFAGLPKNTGEEGILWALMPGMLELLTAAVVVLAPLVAVFAILASIVVAIISSPMLLGIWLKNQFQKHK